MSTDPSRATVQTGVSLEGSNFRRFVARDLHANADFGDFRAGPGHALAPYDGSPQRDRGNPTKAF